MSKFFEVYNDRAMILEIMFSGHDLHVPNSLLVLTPTVIKQFIIVHFFLGSRAEERSETKTDHNFVVYSLSRLNDSFFSYTEHYF